MKSNMENIIRKAIEGGFNADALYGFKLEAPLQIATERVCISDPSFWVALGKACGWDNPLYRGHYKFMNSLVHIEAEKEWCHTALKFHSINLTEGWDKAVEYLQSIIDKEEK